jgi:hypothetical protein
MIELTEEQMQALESRETSPPRIVNSRTKGDVRLAPR